jgi:excisionase family DNA binding protein
MTRKSQSPPSPPNRPGPLALRWNDYDSFTVREAGKILRLSRNAACAAIANGEIPSIRIGRRVVIPRQALEKMLAGG